MDVIFEISTSKLFQKGLSLIWGKKKFFFFNPVLSTKLYCTKTNSTTLKLVAFFHALFCQLIFLYYQIIQGDSQNIKQVSQNFMKALNVDDASLTSQLMTSYRKINITSEKIINYSVTSPSNHCCQISILV